MRALYQQNIQQLVATLALEVGVAEMKLAHPGLRPLLVWLCLKVGICQVSEQIVVNPEYI